MQSLRFSYSGTKYHDGATEKCEQGISDGAMVVRSTGPHLTAAASNKITELRPRAAIAASQAIVVSWYITLTCPLPVLFLYTRG
nr:unnamed protein product [Digitaria exilis]